MNRRAFFAACAGVVLGAGVKPPRTFIAVCNSRPWERVVLKSAVPFRDVYPFCITGSTMIYTLGMTLGNCSTVLEAK